MYPAVLMFRAWLSSPERAAAGVVGIILIVWSVLPLASRPWRPAIKGDMRSGAQNFADFFDGIRRDVAGKSR